MVGWVGRSTSVLLALWFMVLVPTAGADLEDQLGAYSGENAEGYLEPMAGAIGASLNSGLFQTPFIPVEGVRVDFELLAMGIWFSDGDRTFRARTEGGFEPQTSADAPTVVGPGEAVTVPGDGGTTYIFPGGFDIGSFALSVPQIRFGSYRGTEGIFRYVSADLGEADIGSLSLIGFGLRHSISQYFDPDFPVSMAGGFLWQRFRAGRNEAGGDMLKSTTWTIGLQAGKTYGSGWATFAPYVGLSLDSHGMDVAYTSEEDESSTIDISFDTTRSARLTLGMFAKMTIAGVHVEYSLSKRNSLVVGLVLGRL